MSSEHGSANLHPFHIYPYHINMNKLLGGLIVAASLVMSGCGGVYTVTRAPSVVPEQIRSASFSPQDGNSVEVTNYVTEALALQGVRTTAPVAGGVRKANGVDVIVSYLDVWFWDMAPYLLSINIGLYNAKTGDLMVTGKWEDSFMFHGFNRGDSVSRDLIAQMFGKLDVKQQGSEVAAQVQTTDLSTGKSVPQPVGQAGSAANTGESINSKEPRISKYEYEARQQAKALSCQALGLPAVEGIGTSREELTFDCGAGRRVTIVCRSNLGCT